MTKRRRNNDAHIDPEYAEWCRMFPRFPGVVECVRQLKLTSARGSRLDTIAYELAANAASCLGEMIDTYRTEKRYLSRMIIMQALEDAKLPESILFLVEVLRQREEPFSIYAERGLEGINSRESRKALWEAKQK